MRTCSVSTILLIDAYGLNRIKHPPLEPWAVAAAWDALHGRPMSRKREDRLLAELGMEPLPVVVEVPACPDCGSVHHARCHNHDGPAVVLAPGETVRKPAQQRKRPKVRRPWMGYELSVEMDKAGVTDATVRWLVTRYIYERELAGPVPALEAT